MMNGSNVNEAMRAGGRRDLLKWGTSAAMLAALSGDRMWAQARTTQPVAIDMNTSWAPEGFTKMMAHLGRESHGGTPNPLNFDLDRRVKWMDEHGVQTHLLSLGRAMPWQWAPPDVGANLAEIVNDAAIQAHTAFPTRFLGAIELSFLNPGLALKELNRVAGQPGMRAIHLPNSVEGRDYLFSPEFGPLYAPLLARAQELGYPLLFHPLEGQPNNFSRSRLGDPMSRSANLDTTLGAAFEHAYTAARFIITGTLDKYPTLEVVLPDAGGILPYIAGRLQHDSEGRKQPNPKPVFDYIKRFHFDTVTYYPETLRFLIGLLGSDRVVIGSGGFGPMHVENPIALVEQLKLPSADLDKILRGNAARLLHL
jgi:aminocarboxymuconate-semialdehyde decarboxylase